MAGPCRDDLLRLNNEMDWGEHQQQVDTAMEGTRVCDDALSCLRYRY